MIKVAVIPELNAQRVPSPCAYIRLVLPLSRLPAQTRLEIAFISADEITAFQPDVVIAHRISLPTRAALDKVLAHCRKHNVIVIYDLDDDLAALGTDHPDSEFYQQYTPIIQHMAACADQMWVSTEMLATRYEKASKGIVVVPNTLDGRVWRIATPQVTDDVVRFVYVGTRTHQGDFHTLIAPAFDRLKKKFGSRVELDLIGVLDQSPERSPWSIIPVPPLLASCYPAFATWLQARSGYCVGLAPLIDNYFNLAKSNIKVLEYAALGLATIATDLPPFVNGGVGRDLAVLSRPSADDFFDAMSEIAADHRKRSDLQRRGVSEINSLMQSWSIHEPRFDLIEKILREKRLEAEPIRYQGSALG